MIQIIKQFINSLKPTRTIEDEIEAGVKHSINMYYNTYIQLEKYDKQSEKEPTLLADPENLRGYFQPALRRDTIRRAHPPL